MRLGVKLDIGFSQMRWPNLSYYIGSRYLKRLAVLGENGSNMITFAMTYILDPRYTLTFGQQYDTDYGSNVRTELTLFRRYHRLFWGLSLINDDSLDRQAIVFSIWPQGVKELGVRAKGGM